MTPAQIHRRPVTLDPVEAFLLICQARQGVTEVGQDNHGPAVKRYLASTGLPEGYPWCAAYIVDSGKLALGSRWPVPMTASCDQLLQWARREGVLMTEPAKGDLLLVMRNDHDAIHVAAVRDVTAGTGANAGRILTPTWEGNTNDDGGREGYGVFARVRGGKEDPALKAKLYYRYVRWAGAMT